MAGVPFILALLVTLKKPYRHMVPPAEREDDLCRRV
jgi:hypothetical protein